MTALRLVYCITLYKMPELILRAFPLMYRPEHHYVFHVDKKAPINIHQMVARFCVQYPNVHVIDPQIVWWGHWDIMETHLRTMATALELPETWDYWLNITGQDFPSAPAEAITDYLSQQPDACYLGLVPPEQWTSIHHNRVYYQHWLWRSHIVRLPLRRSALPNQAMPTLGSSYMMLPKAACQWLLEDDFSMSLAEYFKTVPCSDEYFAQTALMNSHWATHVVNENRRGALWRDHRPGPLIITSDTLDEVLRHDPFFVRKLIPTSGEDIFKRLEDRCQLIHERV